MSDTYMSMEMYFVIEYKDKDEYLTDIFVRYLTTNKNVAFEYAKKNDFLFYEMKEKLCFNNTKQYRGRSRRHVISYKKPCLLITKQIISPIYIPELKDFGRDLWCDISSKLIFNHPDDEIHTYVPLNKKVNLYIGSIVSPNKNKHYSYKNTNEIKEKMKEYVYRRVKEYSKDLEDFSI